MAKSAVVIGGSLAGLMNGIMLREQGYKVTILEKHSNPSQRGSQAAGIAPGQDFLEFLNRYDRTKRQFSAGKGAAYICASDGSVVRKLPMTFEYSSWAVLYSILRANFDRNASEAWTSTQENLPGEAIYLSGKSATGFDFLDQKVKIDYTDTTSGVHESITADMVIVADGHSSTIRTFAFPETKPHYAGYVTWRCTVQESNVDESTSKYFDNCVKLFNTPQGYFVVYKIPSDEGEIAEGSRYINVVWYANYPEGSKSLQEAMTDGSGKEHANAVPKENYNAEVWAKQKSTVMDSIPLPLINVLEQASSIYVAKVNDVRSPKAVLNEKLFFVGDALNALRPHTAQATNQAAFHCKMLEAVTKGLLTPKTWADIVMQEGQLKGAISVAVGMYGLRKWPSLISAVLWVLKLGLQARLRSLWNLKLGGRVVPGGNA